MAKVKGNNQLPQLNFAQKLIAGFVALMLIAVAFVGLSSPSTPPIDTAGAPYNAYFNFSAGAPLLEDAEVQVTSTAYVNFTSVVNGTYSRAWNYSNTSYITTNPAMPDLGGAQVTNYTPFKAYSLVNNSLLGFYNSTSKPILIMSFDWCGDYDGTTSNPCEVASTDVNAVTVNLTLRVEDRNATLTNGSSAINSTNSTIQNVTSLERDTLFTIGVTWVNGSQGTCTSEFGPASAGTKLLSGCGNGVNVSTIRTVTLNITPTVDLNMSFNDTNATLLAYYYVNTTVADNASFYAWNYSSSAWVFINSNNSLQGTMLSHSMPISAITNYVSGGPLFVQVVPGAFNSTIRAGYSTAIWNITDDVSNQTLRLYSTSSDDFVNVTIFGQTPAGVNQNQTIVMAGATQAMTSTEYANISMVVLNMSASLLNGSIYVQGSDNTTTFATLTTNTTAYTNQSFKKYFLTSSSTTDQTPPNGGFFSKPVDTVSCNRLLPTYITAVADAKNNSAGGLEYQATNTADPAEGDWVAGVNSFNGLDANTQVVFMNGSDAAYRYFRVKLFTTNEGVMRAFNIKLSCTQNVG